ncbi:hypothetical protein ACVNIS_06365 [Sphaerotilaceae bacterium SBD11-9]
MAKVWKLLALLLVITALVWLTTMWRWQSAHVDPSTADIVLTLVALPLALTLLLAGVIWSIGRLRAYAVAPATPVAVAPPEAPTPAPAERPQAPRFQVVSSAVHLRTDSDWSNAQASIAKGECKPELDAQLKDDDGIAVFTAPLPDLSTHALRDEMDKLQARLSQAQPEVWASHEAAPEVLRALASLEMVASSMRDALEAQWPALSAPLPSARSKPSAPTLPPTVSIRVAIPARWPALSQQLASAWIEQLLDPFIESGLKAAGQSRAMAHSMRLAVQLHVHPVDNAEAFWSALDQQLLQWQREKEGGLLWAMAADSLVGENETAALAVAQELFSGGNQRGRVPGEGAAGLLLSSSAWPVPPDAEAPQAQLHRANLLRRDKSADASGRVSPQTLLQSAEDALRASGWQAAQVQHLTCDTDHRASRTGEVFETLQTLLPHLDPSEHALRLGVGCGDLGVARLLACLAITAGQVSKSQQPALVLGAFPAFERFAALLTPATAPPEPAAAQAA